MVIPKRLPYFKANEEKPHKELFKDIGFVTSGTIGNVSASSSDDWLNNRSDEAIKLYKEIISINEFDSSIV